MATTDLAEFVDKALRHCAESGKSLRAVARESQIPPSMISQIRYGKTGVPIRHLSGLSSALSLSQTEHLELIRLVRSDQAKRSVHRGTDYVAELETELRQVRQILTEVSQWIIKEEIQVPLGIAGRIRDVVRNNQDRDFVTQSTSNGGEPQRGNPWSTPPVDDKSNLADLEARNAAGHLVMAEYRVRIYDIDGLLLHGEVVVCLGVDAAIQHVCGIYPGGKLGKWKEGWYRWEVLRKAASHAVIIRYVEVRA